MATRAVRGLSRSRAGAFGGRAGYLLWRGHGVAPSPLLVPPPMSTARHRRGSLSRRPSRASRTTTCQTCASFCRKPPDSAVGPTWLAGCTVLGGESRRPDRRETGVGVETLGAVGDVLSAFAGHTCQ